MTIISHFSTCRCNELIADWWWQRVCCVITDRPCSSATNGDCPGANRSAKKLPTDTKILRVGHVVHCACVNTPADRASRVRKSIAAVFLAGLHKLRQLLVTRGAISRQQPCRAENTVHQPAVTSGQPSPSPRPVARTRDQTARVRSTLNQAQAINCFSWAILLCVQNVVHLNTPMCL